MLFLNYVTIATFSGTTPQRREFSYPTRLTKTASHDDLLHKFRTDVVTGDAPDVPLPDDTIEVRIF